MKISKQYLQKKKKKNKIIFLDSGNGALTDKIQVFVDHLNGRYNHLGDYVHNIIYGSAFLTVFQYL